MTTGLITSGKSVAQVDGRNEDARQSGRPQDAGPPTAMAALSYGLAGIRDLWDVLEAGDMMVEPCAGPPVKSGVRSWPNGFSLDVDHDEMTASGS